MTSLLTSKDENPRSNSARRGMTPRHPLLGSDTQYSFLGWTLTNSHAYDAASNRVSLTAPGGGTTSYTYDSLSRLTGITDSSSGQFGFGYDALGRRISLTRPNSVGTSYSYDSLSRLLSVLHNGGSLPGSASYTYDAAGNRLTKTAVQAGNPNPVSVLSQYSYDPIYELTQAVVNGTVAEGYTYDAVGSRLTSAGPVSYNYNTSNELTSTSAATYAYDNNGNTTSKTTSAGTTSYSWDFENRLASATLPGTGGRKPRMYYFTGNECAMRNHDGKLMWVIVRPFLAVMLLLVLSATICQAQCFNVQDYGDGDPAATITPQIWAPGQSYVVTIMSPNDPWFIPTRSYGSSTAPAGYVATAANLDAFLGDSINWPSEDPYVALGPVVYVSPSEIEFTVSVAANAPTENDYFVDDCWPSLFWAPVTITPTTNPPDNGSNLGPCDDCNTQAGAPINVTNGNVWVQQRDYRLPGLGGGLALVRTWNSLLGSVGPPNVAGMFGQSWRSTYEEMLVGPDSNNNLKYWRGDGSAWTFAYNGALSSYSLLSPPNQRAQLWSNPTGGFTLALADGTQKVFNAQDLLSAIIDRNGNQTTLAYDSSNRLTSVTSAGGSTLTFTYGNSNNPTQVTTVQDSVGTVATYTYDSSSRLTLVSYPDGSALNFTYDPNSSMLLSVTDSQGKLMEAHTYDTQGRGLTSTRANGADSVSLSY